MHVSARAQLVTPVQPEGGLREALRRVVRRGHADAVLGTGAALDDAEVAILRLRRGRRGEGGERRQGEGTVKDGPHGAAWIQDGGGTTLKKHTVCVEESVPDANRELHGGERFIARGHHNCPRPPPAVGYI